MKKPTIHEVRTYFKNAKKVRCLNSPKMRSYVIDLDTIYSMNERQINCKAKDTIYCALWVDGKYAEIISYKTKEYIVDETFIKDAYDSACSDWKTKIKDKFPDVFKSIQLEINKWYKSDSGGLWFITDFINGNINNQISYGFNMSREWDVSKKRVSTGLVLATESEIKDALINEAKKRGFKSGNYKCLSGGTHYTHSDDYCFEDGKLFSGWNNKDSRNIVFGNGTWATIIPQTEVTQSDLITFYCESKNIDKDNLKVI